VGFWVVAAVTLATALLIGMVDSPKRLQVVRLVIATAGGEEVLHRSALLAVWASTPVGPVVAAVVNAVAFGAWHVAGAWGKGHLGVLEVAVPTLGAFVFLWARLRYRSVAVPVILHLAINLFAELIFG
jgi:membrane protease YdiL (CAAX protease family)